MKIKLFNHQNELIGILLEFPEYENNQELEESIIEYINENTDVDENEINYYEVVWQNVSDTMTQWYTSQLKISIKQLIYFYKLNTRQTG